MCDLNKIGGLIAAACAAVLVATVLCAAAAVAAGTFYGALGNSALMIAAAVAIGLALVSINVAIQSVGPCTLNPCKAPGETLQNALIALAIGLTVLLAALILGIFAASIPWAGTAVAIGLGIGAAAIGIALIVAGSNLRALETCLGTARSVGVGVATALVVITVIALVIVTGGVVFGGW
jgi:hypothetical protein